MAKLLLFQPPYDRDFGAKAVHRMMYGPHRTPDQIAAEVKERYPAHYARWKKVMVHSCRRSLRQYRSDPHPIMTPDEFTEHLLSNYETAVVKEVFDRMMPKLVKSMKEPNVINIVL